MAFKLIESAQARRVPSTRAPPIASRVVVTGGRRFIGAFLVKRLVTEGWGLAVIDMMVRGDAGVSPKSPTTSMRFRCDVCN